MSGNFVTINGTLSAAVATSGTFTATLPIRPAPSPTTVATWMAGDFLNGGTSQLVLNGGNLTFSTDFSFSISGSTVTITNRSASTWPTGASWYLALEIGGKPMFRTDGEPRGTQKRMPRMLRDTLVQINLGTPATASANYYSVSATVTSPAAAVLAATVPDVPRNVVGAWTNTATVTVVGFDEYGQAMTETSGSGTSFTGAKAFARITSITPSATITGATFGTGVVLGLPVFLSTSASILREMLDGATATAGTTVAGVRTAGGSTATTGDVRGTYNPNSAPNGSRSYQLICALKNPTDIGQAPA
jgi:hypothetical protein